VSGMTMMSFLRWWKSLGDRRSTLRHSLRQSGFVDFDGAQRQCCVIYDISQSGARITFPAGNEPPGEFTLFVPHRCRIVRRMDNQVGVRFVESDCPV
jgi:hypothetical protein